MKTKYIRSILYLLGGMMVLNSCMEDLGNYKYVSPADLISIEIDSLESNYYFKTQAVESCRPVIKGMDNEENYQFTWYYLRQGEKLEKADTLSHTKELVWQVACEPGYYDLVFEVLDKRTGLYVNKRMTVKVESVFGHGWYILKDMNNETDVDFIYPDGHMDADLFFTKEKTRLKGEAISMSYQDYMYSYEEQNADGTISILKNKKAIHVVSSQDIKVFRADNMRLLKNYEDVFYEVPSVRLPQLCQFSGMSLYLINAGKIQTIFASSPNVGKVALPKSGDYELYPGCIGVWDGALVFDRKSQSFYGVQGLNPDLIKLSEPDVSDQVKVSPNHMNVQMLHLLNRTSGGAYALMKSDDPKKNEYYLAGIKFASVPCYPFTSFETLPADCKIVNSKVMGAHQQSACIYFASDNELYMHSVADVADREKKIYSFSNLESISYIAHIVSTDSKDSFNQLVVLTNSARGWKMYRFNFDGDTPEIIPVPVVPVYSGTGKAEFVLFRLG